MLHFERYEGTSLGALGGDNKKQKLEFELALGVFPFSYTLISTIYIFVVLGET